jgi:hypothetical protein
MSRLRFACSVAFSVFIASAPAFADVWFTDSTFNPLNYSQTSAYQSLATITASQCATCGNPGFALQVKETFGDTTVNTGEAALGFVNNTFSYDPTTQGAINSIAVATIDKDATVTGLSGTFGNTFRPMIEQDGNYYLAAIVAPNFPAPGTTGFLTISQSGLLATDFVQFDFSTGAFGTAHPDFAGDPMLFGLTQISTVAGFPAGPALEQDYDNLSLTISNTPEPSSIWLLVSLLTFVGLALRRRRFNVS